MIREARHDDLDALLRLYLHLHEQRVPDSSPALAAAWAVKVAYAASSVISHVTWEWVGS